MFDKINAGRLQPVAWTACGFTVFVLFIIQLTLLKIAFLRNATTDTVVNKVHLKTIVADTAGAYVKVINVRGRPESPVPLSSGRLSRQTFRCSCVRDQTCLTPLIVLPLDRG
jgi:hypothetical protein